MHTPATNPTVQQLASSGTLPTKRPRSTSIPSSPTGSASSKRAISEDDFSSDRTAMRAEADGVSGSSPVAAPDADVASDGVAEQTEVAEMGSLNIEDEGEEQKKYKELYSELLSAKPPPYEPYRRYALIPTSLTKQLQAAAFQPTVAAVELDMSSLVQDTEGEEVRVIATREDLDGPGFFLHHMEPRKERMWKLKAGLVEDEDFIYISEEGWNKIATGLNATDKPSLLRFCVSDRIQLVPPVYTMYILIPPSLIPDIAQITTAPIRFTCPPETTMFTFSRLLQALAGQVTGSEAKKAAPLFRVWTFVPSSLQIKEDGLSAALQKIYLAPDVVRATNSSITVASKMDDSEQTCDDKGLQDGDAFIIELAEATRGATTDPDWVSDRASTPSGNEFVINMPPVPKAPAPLFSKPAAYAGTATSNSLVPEGFGMATRSQRKERDPVKTRGLVGLQNLGNTCFMNSAVQCLSNTPELNKYFLSSVYKEEINRDNPLGMHGLIADAFGQVVESLWSDHPNSSFSPRQLKQYTGKFAPQFQGYGQHDTQEFIAFLLDGLHEDLNRIYKKPYIEKPDWKAGGGDLELAQLGKECWEGYKKRNDSVIVDLFQGQLMSTLICPECHKESITLDPFMYLTVPLPIAQTRPFRCRFVPSDPEKGEIEVSLLIPANASFMQIKERLGALVDANPLHMVGGDLFRSAFYRWWFDGDHNGECKSSDLAVFYDLGVPTTSTRKAVGTVPTEGTITVPVYTCKTAEPSKYLRGNDTTPTENCLTPFFITLTRAEAGDALAVRHAVAKGYTRFLKEDQDLWVPSSSTHAMVPMTPAEEQPLELSTGEEERVTEIHLDGAEPRVVEVPLARSGANSPVHSLKSAHGNLSSTSLATLASARSAKLVPRADVYKIHVADASSSEDISGSSFNPFKKEKKGEQPGVHNLWRGDAKQASSSWSSLESRRKAKKEKGNMFGRITGNLFGGSDKGDDDEREGRSKSNGQGSSSRAESPVAGASTSQAPQLVVRPGEAIFVEWSPKMYYEFIDESALRATSTIVDPLIEKEKQRRAAGKAISLEECLDEFSKEETLGQDDLWYCPVCKKHQAATKKLDIYKAPDILVICIKRFGSSRRLSDKLDNLVNFPLEGLDLGERVGERRVAKALGFSKQKGQEYGMDLDWDELPPTEITAEGEGNMVYDLYAVDNHFGGLGGGHYTAFCKNREDGQWWNYDDSRVSKANPEAVQSRAAYLLFYRRRTARPIGGISRVKAEEAESRAASRAASRAPSPAPSAGGMTGSRTLPPSGLHHATSPMRVDSDDGDQLPSDDSESEAEMTDDDDDKLPSYSRSGSVSASLNSESPAGAWDDAASDRDKSEEDEYRQARLNAAGLSSAQIGFGNGDRWNLSSSAAASSVNFGFGSSTGTTSVKAPSQAPSPAPTSGMTTGSESAPSTLVTEAHATSQTSQTSGPSDASTARQSASDDSNVSIKPASEGMDVDEA